MVDLGVKELAEVVTEILSLIKILVNVNPKDNAAVMAANIRTRRNLVELEARLVRFQLKDGNPVPIGLFKEKTDG